MTGQLVTILGPSGAGKDTILHALRDARPEFHIVRRVITRPESAGGEAFDGVDDATFSARLRAGAFALHWRAHDLSYGIPANIDAELANGKTVVFNGSRAALPEALARYPSLRVILLTASPDVLISRLVSRGRESLDQIAARLERADYSLPLQIDATQIVNDGTVAETVAQVIQALELESISR